jgi:hypothetical protein
VTSGKKYPGGHAKIQGFLVRIKFDLKNVENSGVLQ